jgi:SHS2 domain-containing protein
MPYRWIDHTGELEVELEASTEHGLFEAGFQAMRELLSDGAGVERMDLQVELSGRDRAALLADWLGELAVLAETRGVALERLSALELEEDGLRARVEGREGDLPHLVKGATYHRLRLERLAGRWRARVVLDV